MSLTGSGVMFVEGKIKSPQLPGEELCVPVYVKLWSDDLPDDVENRHAAVEATVRRV